MQTKEALALALDLADAADAVTLSRFRAVDLEVRTKADRTPVTEADSATELRLRELIASRTNGHVVAGEEFGDDGEAEYRWIIDPIDGTKNYMRGVPIWATLIGLERAGELVVGVVSAPALGSRWWAGVGLGAYRDGQQIRVSGVQSLTDAQMSFAWDSDGSFEETRDRILGLSRACWRTRSLGDFWQHVLVADGSFDVSIDPVLAYWDCAAILPIISEAGGRWSTLEGENPQHPGSLICTNALLHDAVLEMMR